MDEQVVPILDGVMWQPNAPDAVLSQNDFGRACLALNAHGDDADRRCVVLVWTGCSRVVMGYPNDEGSHQHRLYASGFRGLLWAGQVLNSTWIASGASVSLRHFIVPTKEKTVEVVADHLEVQRIAGTTREAAFEALGR